MPPGPPEPKPLYEGTSTYESTEGEKNGKCRMPRQLEDSRETESITEQLGCSHCVLAGGGYDEQLDGEKSEHPPCGRDRVEGKGRRKTVGSLAEFRKDVQDTGPVDSAPVPFGASKEPASWLTSNQLCAGTDQLIPR